MTFHPAARLLLDIDCDGGLHRHCTESGAGVPPAARLPPALLWPGKPTCNCMRAILNLHLHRYRSGRGVTMLVSNHYLLGRGYGHVGSISVLLAACNQIGVRAGVLSWEACRERRCMMLCASCMSPSVRDCTCRGQR